MSRLPFPPARLFALGAIALAACSGDGAVAPAPIVPVTRTITVDAAAAYAYLALDTIAQAVPIANPSVSTGWDMGFFATGVTLNGGAAGPGAVAAYCLCQNDGRTNAEIQAMTPDNQLASFDAIGAAAIPSASSFTSDQLDPVISGWYSGVPGTAGVSPAPGRAWIVREGAGTVVLAKVQVTGVTGGTATSPGTVTFQYAVQPSAGAAFGPVQTQTVSTAAGPVYFDLTTGQVTSAANWDLQFDGWNIRVNGGVSGTGTVKAVLDMTTPFANIDAAYAATAPAQAYRADIFSGVFAQHAWYKYNITGTDNQIWPTFQVYLLRRGTTVFKVQLIGYYSASGAPRNITVRYAKLTE